MKLKLAVAALVAGMLVQGTAFAACTRPADPEIPSGDKSAAMPVSDQDLAL